MASGVLKIEGKDMNRYRNSILTAAALVVAMGFGVVAEEAEAARACPNIPGTPNKNCVKKKDIAKGAVNESRIKDGAVTGSKVSSDSLGAEKLTDEPGIDYVNETDDDGSGGSGKVVSLSPTWLAMEDVAVTHPGPGYVTCIGTGHADWDPPTPYYAGNVNVGWSNASGATAPANFNRTSLKSDVIDGSTYIPLTGMYTFEVTGAGTTTYYFKGSLSPGASPDVIDYYVHSIVCMYFPTRY